MKSPGVDIDLTDDDDDDLAILQILSTVGKIIYQSKNHLFVKAKWYSWVPFGASLKVCRYTFTVPVTLKPLLLHSLSRRFFIANPKRKNKVQSKQTKQNFTTASQ